MGSATVRLDPGMEAPADFGTVTFGLPLCADHAHLLRQGCTLRDFRSGTLTVRNTPRLEEVGSRVA